MTEIKCPQCGHHNTGGNFCSECGAPLTAKAAAGSPKGGPAKGSTAIRDFLIVISALAAVTVGYFLLKTPEKVPQPPKQATAQSQMPAGHEGMDMSQMSKIHFPPDYASLVKFGNETMDAGNFPVAAESYRRALAIDSSSADVRTDFGACLHGMGLPDRALEEFRRVIKEHPEHAIANFNLGIVFHAIGKDDSAKFYWQKYLKIDPNGSAAAAAKKYLKELGG